MNLPELQKILDTAPGADVDFEFFEELKTALNSLLLLNGANAGLPVYTDNEAALLDEAAVGSLYADETGIVRVVLEGVEP